MCFGGGGGSSPSPPVQTPAVPVDQITAGNPTVTVAPNPANNPPTPAPRSAPTPSSQVSGASGLNM